MKTCLANTRRQTFNYIGRCMKMHENAPNYMQRIMHGLTRSDLKSERSQSRTLWLCHLWLSLWLLPRLLRQSLVNFLALHVWTTHICDPGGKIQVATGQQTPSAEARCLKESGTLKQMWEDRSKALWKIPQRPRWFGLRYASFGYGTKLSCLPISTPACSGTPLPTVADHWSQLSMTAVPKFPAPRVSGPLGFSKST